MVVVAHVIFQGIETDVDMGVGLGSTSFAVEAVFVSVYLVELGMRLAVYQKTFFKDSWNLFDSDLIVVASLMSSNSSGGVIVVLRCFRIGRLARVLRLFRIFKPLWLLVCGIAKSMKTVMWAWIVI